MPHRHRSGERGDQVHDRGRRARIGRLDEDAARGFGRRVEVIIQKPLRGRAVDRCGEEHAVGGEAFGIIADQQLARRHPRQRVVLDRDVRRAGRVDVRIAGDVPAQFGTAKVTPTYQALYKSR